LGEVLGLLGVGRRRALGGLDRAEPAAAGAGVAEQHHRRGAAAPALVHVGAARLLAHRGQALLAQERLEAGVAVAPRNAGADPGRQAARRARGGGLAHRADCPTGRGGRNARPPAEDGLDPAAAPLPLPPPASGMAPCWPAPPAGPAVPAGAVARRAAAVHPGARARRGPVKVEAGAQRCPKCVTSKLLHVERGGMTVELCPSCRGLWLDPGELTVMLELYRRLDADAGGNAGVFCLRCGDIEMRELAFPGTEVQLDCCPRCQGVWLD